MSVLSVLLFICGDFNFHVDTTSNDGIKFLNLLEPYSVTQYVHTSTHLHGHALDLVLTPTKPTVVSNVWVGVLVLIMQKINMQSLRCDLVNCSFATYPLDTLSETLRAIHEGFKWLA